jgi:hypothetical protein
MLAMLQFYAIVSQHKTGEHSKVSIIFFTLKKDELYIFNASLYNYFIAWQQDGN